MNPEPAASSAPLIRLAHIRKSFGEVSACRDISLDIREGRILALLGENGAGKSTLMSILAGRLRPDAGHIKVDGRPAVFSSARDAIRAGVGMVYQHFMLVDAMTVTENVFLGQENGFWLHPKKMRAHVAGLAEKFRLDIDPAARVRDLSMGEKQRVEILKLLHRDSRILIFDEPTAVLTPQEADHLFGAMKEMAARGKALIFISHKLREVLDAADDIAILRRGEIMEVMAAASVTSRTELARRMVGRDVFFRVEKAPVRSGRRVLTVRGLGGGRLKDIGFELHRGEIFGVVGVAGNGQKSLVEVICGLAPPESGMVRILNRDWKRYYRRFRKDEAVSYIPEDRLGLATCPGLNLKDNFLLTTRRHFSRGPWLRKRAAARSAGETVSRYDVRPGDTNALAGQLSGGNLQKMVLGREFFRMPRLIVAEQPTQGLDISATEDIWRHLIAARETAGILLVTGDLSEALALSDRIAVMFDGRFMDVFAISERDKVAHIGEMMAGMPLKAGR
ncbi:MAG: branched-chain amino acid ABC transporter ATP-binding protein [Desulfobacterales bacterium]|nr:MAG: branched-chain amino acid ABC transporter ATP-binding protein [Desulfobacterales bacterium]